MYTIVERRKMNAGRMQETIERAQKEYFPKMRQAEGFVGFYLVADAEQGINNAIIVWTDKAHAEAFVPEWHAWESVLTEMGHEIVSANQGDTVVSFEGRD